MDEFDQVQRVTRLVGRSAAVGVPTWIILLATLPFTGLGVIACLSLATVVATGAVVLLERRRRRREAPAPVAGPPGRRPMSALTAAALTLGGVLLLVYVIFVIRAA